MKKFLLIILVFYIGCTPLGLRVKTELPVGEGCKSHEPLSYNEMVQLPGDLYSVQEQKTNSGLSIVTVSDTRTKSCIARFKASGLTEVDISLAAGYGETYFALKGKFYDANKKFCSAAADVIDCLGELRGPLLKVTKDIFFFPPNSRQKQFLTFHNGVLFGPSYP